MVNRFLWLWIFPLQAWSASPTLSMNRSILLAREGLFQQRVLLPDARAAWFVVLEAKALISFIL